MLAEAVCDAGPDARVALSGVVEESRDENVGVGDALAAERRDDIEPMTLVRDMHRVEEAELGGRQPGGQPRPLVRPHLGPDVRAELADLSGPPGS